MPCLDRLIHFGGGRINHFYCSNISIATLQVFFLVVVVVLVYSTQSYLLFKINYSR